MLPFYKISYVSKDIARKEGMVKLGAKHRQRGKIANRAKKIDRRAKISKGAKSAKRQKSAKGHKIALERTS